MKLLRYIALCGVILLSGGICMQFPKMGGARSYSVKVPKLSGGVNTSESPHLIADNQLSDCLNMWWKDGALRSRQGLWTGEDEENNKSMTAPSSATPNSTVSYYRLGNSFLVQKYNSSPDWISAWWHMFDENGFYNEVDCGWIHSGSNPSEFTVMFSSVNSSTENSLSNYGAIAYVSDGNVLGINALEADDLSDEIYIPTISINGVPSETTDGVASGDVNEEKNMLTPKFKCTFTTDGVGKYYFLPLKGLDDTDIVIERIAADGSLYTWTIPAGTNATTGLTYNANVNRAGGYLWFTDSSNAVHPMTAGSTRNNLTITASKTSPGDMAKICGMRFNTWYGGDASGLRGGTRLFVSGNPEYPNLVHWSDVNNPLYFPEGNFKYVGGDSQKVTAFGKQGNMLVVFKERETYRLGFQSREVTADQTKSGIYITQDYILSVVPINAYIGCDIPNTIQLCANNLVWMNTNGKVYMLASSNQYSENTVRELSLNVESKIALHTNTEILNASAADYDGHYYLLIGNKVYVMDYRSGSFSYYASYVDDKKTQRNIEWYIWDCDIDGVTWHRILGEGTQPIMCGSYEESGSVFLINYVFSALSGYNDYTPDGELQPVPCMLQTKVFDFNNPTTYKSINEMHIGVGREITNPVIRFTYLTDKGQADDAYIMYPTKKAVDADSPEYIEVRKITPRLNRIKRFGIKVESDNAMSVDSLVLRYSPYGGVR